MTPDAERARALEPFGYTARQAQFLALVALHGGSLLRRQFVAFTGRGHGLATVRFLNHVMTRGHVRPLPYGRHGQVFHLSARPLYAALGEEHNRNRRMAEWEAVTRKVMTLDFVLEHPTARFWATEADKTALLQERGVRQDLWPARTYLPRQAGTRITTRHFVDKMPWHQGAGDTRLWVAYVDAEHTLNGFEMFLNQYRPLLGAVPSGVTYVAPNAWRGAVQRVFDKVIVRGAQRDLDAGTFLTYCQQRYKVDTHQWGALPVADLQTYRALHVRFSTTSFEALYQRWRESTDKAISSSDVDAAARLDCVLQVYALGNRYRSGHADEAGPR